MANNMNIADALAALFGGMGSSYAEQQKQSNQLSHEEKMARRQEQLQRDYQVSQQLHEKGLKAADLKDNEKARETATAIERLRAYEKRISDDKYISADMQKAMMQKASEHERTMAMRYGYDTQLEADLARTYSQASWMIDGENDDLTIQEQKDLDDLAQATMLVGTPNGPSAASIDNVARIKYAQYAASGRRTVMKRLDRFRVATIGKTFRDEFTRKQGVANEVGEAVDAQGRRQFQGSPWSLQGLGSGIKERASIIGQEARGIGNALYYGGDAWEPVLDTALSYRGKPGRYGHNPPSQAAQYPSGAGGYSPAGFSPYQVEQPVPPMTPEDIAKAKDIYMLLQSLGQYSR